MATDYLDQAAELLRPTIDFPKPGITYFDITPVLRSADTMEHLVNLIAEHWREAQVDVVAGLDARGFIFGSLVAARLGVGFEQVRKRGKLPGDTTSQTYDLEYGTSEIEMVDDGFIRGKRVLLIDDLLASGGTALAGTMLVERLGGTVVGLSVITELPALGGRGKLLDYQVHSLISIIDGVKHTGVEYCVDVLPFDPETDDLILIQRLSEPCGIAMPGGRIERESARKAAERELLEETGCQAKQVEFQSVLAAGGRDPRGIKVSLVMTCVTDTSNATGEEGKTSIKRIRKTSEVPPAEMFVLGHFPSVVEGRAARHGRQAFSAA